MSNESRFGTKSGKTETTNELSRCVDVEGKQDSVETIETTLKGVEEEANRIEAIVNDVRTKLLGPTPDPESRSDAGEPEASCVLYRLSCLRHHLIDVGNDLDACHRDLGLS